MPTASAASEHHRRDKLNYILHDPPPRSSSKGTPVPGPYRYPRVSQRLRLPGSDDEREEEDEAEDEDDDEHTVDDAAAATAAAAADAAAASTRHLSLALSGGADSDDESDIANDVVHDPFFLKYTLQGGTSDHEVEEDDSEDEDDDDDDRDSSSSDADTVGPRSPASPRAFRQDSITDPLYSPGPSSPRTFPPLSPAASFASLASITSAAGAPSPAAKARAAAATSNRATEFSNPFGDATQRHDSSAMQEVNIAVVGARGIGKSTFIQNAFGLSGKPEERSVQRPMVLERIVYHCRLIEVQLDDLDVDDDGQKICWPENVGESFLPRIDGMFLLYNAQNQESMECEDLLREYKALFRLFRRGTITSLSSNLVLDLETPPNPGLLFFLVGGQRTAFIACREPNRALPYGGLLSATNPKPGEAYSLCFQTLQLSDRGANLNSLPFYRRRLTSLRSGRKRLQQLGLRG